MRLRYRIAVTLSALLLVLGAAVANASKPVPAVYPFSPESGHPSQPPTLNSTCQLGVTDPPAYYIPGYVLPPNDAYYNLVNPANCPCPTGAVQLTDIHFYLQFFTDCSIPVQVSVVGATGQAGCYRPDPSVNLCAPLTYNLAPGGAGGFPFTLPLPTGCCINGPAFIGLTFLADSPDCNTAATRPAIVTTAICNPCVSYNVYPPTGFDDLCVDIGLPGNLAMYADAECCAVTPTHGSTWGRVKVLYR